MRISVLISPPPSRLTRIWLPGLENINLENLLYFPIPRHANLLQLDNVLYELPSAFRRSTDAVVLRAHDPEAKELLTRPELQDRLSHRIEMKPLWLLTANDREYRLTDIRSKTSETTTLNLRGVPNLVNILRHAEMFAYARQPGAFLPAAANFHYEGPNGGHYESFLRVGTALQSMDVLDGISFWILPYVTLDTSIILDSSSILALGLNLSRYIVDCGYATTSQIRLVECIRSYDEPPQALVQRLLNSGDQFAHLLVILSASSTGRLRDRLVTALQGISKQLTVITLYSSADSTGSVPASREQLLCQLGSELSRHEPANCPLCRARSEIIRIDRHTYLLEVAAGTSKIRITKKNAKDAREFLDRYRGTGSISVHRDQHDRQRHHMIHIDATKLYNKRQFQVRLENILAPLRNHIEIVMSPSHSAAQILANFVGNYLKLSPIICNEHNLEQLHPLQADQVRKAKQILIVDDVVITGDRLREYKHFLRIAGFLRQNPDVHWLVAVARPPSTEELNAVIDMIGTGNFHAVETVLLPNWAENCPWCGELNKLERVDRSVVTPTMARRYHRLKKKAVGLKKRLFLHWSSDGALKTALSLGPRSIFGDKLSDVELFFSVASAIQHLRSSGDLSEEYVPPLAKVLSPTFYLRGRYYDAIILAAIIRCASRHDLRSPLADSRLIAALKQRLRERASVELRSEILLGMIENKLPRIVSVIDDDEFWTGERGVCSFLSSMLAKAE